VEVPPERLVSWIVTFTERHGGPLIVASAEPAATVTFAAADGATAECHVPFPPLRPPLPSLPLGSDAPPSGADPLLSPPLRADAPPSQPSGANPLPFPPLRADPGEQVATGTDARAFAEAIAAHAAADRTVGVLLVRLGGYAVGVFSGVPPRLGPSKTGRRLVHGRSAAGGWSQHRFARRRENQAAVALGAAADAAAGIFGGYGAAGLDAVVLGGDKRSVAGLRDDARLAPYLSRATDRFLTVPDPSPAVLKGIPPAYQAIRIRLTEPEL
jgi:Actinobacteria/chloroflexi VLRF1 release factor